ncbi:ATPase-like protein [Talaromyces proteolyticus]|uniref:ATPase-like protein n=1 Tax=Talaromyces proteolyticus TaxID=1131652 RepID=A0AAD4KP64_9EURO|nr:ATPase-like protein [Talaromyces proteolyticus]KAH8693633.1 ATPase-like protein [Talaromyces proteolyticus]
MLFSGCSHDNSFGPTVYGCRDDFDFTITFERIFFSLVPASLFIAIALVRVVSLAWRPQIVKGAILRWVKLAITLVPNAFFTSSMAVELVSSLSVAAVSFIEHSRSPRPSILLHVYLLVTILLDIAQVRTLWLASTSPDDIRVTGLVTAEVVVKACLLLVESRSKARWTRWDQKQHSPEETSGLFGLAAFVWIDSLFMSGFKKVLTINDLLPLDKSMATESLERALWDRIQTLKSNGQKLGLLKALVQALKTPLLLPVVPRLAWIGFRFCQPFLIHTLLDRLQEPNSDSSDHAKNVGYSLIGATILIYSGIAISSALYWYLHERTLCMFRGTLAGVIYKKTTEIELSSTRDSAALTLMSTDIEKIRLGFLNLHELWANTVEVALASWLVERQIGAAFVAPLIIVFCCAVLAAFVSRYAEARQKSWMGKIQKRVRLTANVISDMKHLKISGLSSPVYDLIQEMRVDELKAASRFRLVYVIVATLGYVPLALSPVITFAVTSRTLDVSRIFTSVSYLLLLADPLGYLFQNIPNLLAALACINRIQEFLEKNPRVDYRLPFEAGVEKKDWKTEGPTEKFDPAITIINGSFGWTPDRMVLKNVDLHITRSQLTMVVGPIASGKSTLCKVLLGETPYYHGKVLIDAGLLSRQVGYCDQTPYLSNTTIRENILGFAAYNERKYREVIEATMLKADLSTLPKGDETVIGSNGITLSGGQKQRLSTARALYTDSKLFMFDDVLKGLDAVTEEQVFHRVFGPGGLLRRRNATVILCTHSVRYLQHADYVVALGEEGRVVEQGTFSSLISSTKYVRSLGIKISDVMNARMDEEDEDRRRSKPELKPVTLTETSSSMDKKARMNGDPTVYRHYLASIGKRFIAVFVVFGLGWGFFYNWGTIWLQYWSNNVSSYPTHTSSFYIGLYALFQVAYICCLLLCFLICFRTMIRISGSRLHKAALATVINAPLKFFATTDTGLVTNLFSQDMTLIDNELPIALTNLAMDMPNATGMAAVVAISSPYLVISYPFIFAVLYGIQKFYLRTARQLRLLDLETKSPLYTHFLDTVKGVATFRAFGWVQAGIAANNELLDTSQQPFYLLAIAQRWLGFSLQLVVALLAIMVVTLSTQLGSRAGLTGASLVTLMTFGDILNYIMGFLTQLETSIGAISRLKHFSEDVMPEGSPEEDFIPPSEWPSRGFIHIDGVSASYDASDDDKSTLAVSNLTLTIQAGERVVICGRTGSGKSSVILLLLRLLDPLPMCAENITIDDTPLHKIDRIALRQRIIAIPQDVVFLPDGTTFKSNLDPFAVSTNGECQDALKTVGLWPFVTERGGLEGPLDPDTLSQGQKQLFSLARAILRRRIRDRDAPENGKGILLLDEIGSGVDISTDQDLHVIIRKEFRGYTIVMVSHRLKTVMDFDTVVVMDKGCMVEKGEPQLLVREEGSRFGELWVASQG